MAIDRADTSALAERDLAIVELRREGATIAEIAGACGLSAERVRQIVRRAEGSTPKGRRGRAPRADGERVRLRIGNLAKAVLVTGQAYQDPKDALNEFVSNAADDYAEAGLVGARIRVMLRRKGVRNVIAVDDGGRGMGPDRLRGIARNLFESAKAGDDRTLGEKAIGLLAFQQLGGRCDVVSREAGSDETWTLRLQRGEASADLLARSGAPVRRPARRYTSPSSTARRRGSSPSARSSTTCDAGEAPAIARGDYTIEVVEGHTAELVTPEEPSGVPVPVAAHDTLWGKLEFALYAAPDSVAGRRIAVVGRAGTTIIDDLCELEEFDHDPWNSGQVSGRICFEPLRQTAGRRAVLRDDEIYPVFRDAVQASEPLVRRAVERVRKEVDDATTARLSDTLRQIFDRVLKELADLENPMRTLVGDESGDGDGIASQPELPAEGSGEPTVPSVDELEPRPPRPIEPAERPPGAAAGGRHRHLPSVAPDPHPGRARSRFDADPGTVLYNEQHADFLLVKDDEASLLDYLATLVAKEYVVYNNPRAESDDLAEELVRMLVACAATSRSAAGRGRPTASDDVRRDSVLGEEEAGLDLLVGALELAILVLDDDGVVVAGPVEGADEPVPAHLAEPRQARDLPAHAGRQHAAVVEPVAVDLHVLGVDVVQARAELAHDPLVVDHLPDEV